MGIIESVPSQWRWLAEKLMCPRYGPLIGPEWSRDLDKGLWLVQSDHVTWILASYWSDTWEGGDMKDERCNDGMMHQRPTRRIRCLPHNIAIWDPNFLTPGAVTIMIILILNRGQRGQVRLAGHSRWRLLTTEKFTNSNIDGANYKTKSSWSGLTTWLLFLCLTYFGYASL